MIAVVTSGKGGVGKSTVCMGLSCALAKRGKRVLVIDTDAGLRSLDLMFNVADDAVYNLQDVLLRRCEPSKAIFASPLAEGVFVMPAPEHADGIADLAAFSYLCRGLAEHYDVVLIDCPAGIGRGFKAAASVADRAIIVATPDPVCARNAYLTSVELDKLGLSYKMIINRLRPRAVIKGKLLDIDTVMDTAQVPLLGVVPEDDTVTFSTAAGQPLPKKSNARRCFDNIAARFCGESVPLAKLKSMG